MENTALMAEFLTDLNKEEVVGFQLLMNRFAGTGRGRWMRLCVALLFSASLIALCVSETVQTGEIDWLTGIIGGLLALVSLGFTIVEPLLLKKQAARSYEESCAAGYSFFGTVRVYPDRIEKEGRGVSVTIPLNGTAFFLENPEMLVIGSDRTRSIVLSARCTTQEQAAAVRQAVERIPVNHRRFYGRLLPRGEKIEPAPWSEPAVLWQQTVCYTLAELGSMLRNGLRQNYIRRVPLFALVSLLAGLALGWNNQSVIPCVLYFLLCMLLLTVLNWGLPSMRIPRNEEQAPPASRQLQWTLTDRGLRLRSERQEDCVPWSAVAHVIDRGDYVEFCWYNRSARLPRRCIEDFEAFDGMISQYWKN